MAGPRRNSFSHCSKPSAIAARREGSDLTASPATDPHDLAALAEAIPLPLNVLVVPDLSLPDLARLGVRRVSTGSLPYRAAPSTPPRAPPPQSATAGPSPQPLLVLSCESG